MRVLSAAIFVSLTVVTAAQAAPQALYGKSITVSWLESRSQRDGHVGTFKPVGLPYVTTFYISSEGRLFQRTTVRGSGAAARFGNNDRVGTSGSSAEGARNVTFSGNKIVMNSAFQGAGRHIEVNFDGSFASCSAQVITAMPNGAKTAVVRSIVTGGDVEFESVSAGPASCSITSGNSF